MNLFNQPTPQSHLESSLKSYEERKRLRRESKSGVQVRVSTPTATVQRDAQVQPVANGSVAKAADNKTAPVTLTSVPLSKKDERSPTPQRVPENAHRQDEEKRFVTRVFLGNGDQQRAKVDTARTVPVVREPLHIRAHSEPKLVKPTSPAVESPFGAVLRSVGPPVEKCGVETGRVIDQEVSAR